MSGGSAGHRPPFGRRRLTPDMPDMPDMPVAYLGNLSSHYMSNFILELSPGAPLIEFTRSLDYPEGLFCQTPRRSEGGVIRCWCGLVLCQQPHRTSRSRGSQALGAQLYALDLTTCPHRHDCGIGIRVPMIRRITSILKGPVHELTIAQPVSQPNNELFRVRVAAPSISGSVIDSKPRPSNSAVAPRGSCTAFFSSRQCCSAGPPRCQ
jgi:hypothetical protein